MEIFQEFRRQHREITFRMKKFIGQLEKVLFYFCEENNNFSLPIFEVNCLLYFLRIHHFATPSFALEKTWEDDNLENNIEKMSLRIRKCIILNSKRFSFIFENRRTCFPFYSLGYGVYLILRFRHFVIRLCLISRSHLERRSCYAIFFRINCTIV